MRIICLLFVAFVCEWLKVIKEHKWHILVKVMLQSNHFATGKSRKIIINILTSANLLTHWFYFCQEQWKRSHHLIMAHVNYKLFMPSRQQWKSGRDSINHKFLLTNLSDEFREKSIYKNDAIFRPFKIWKKFQIIQTFATTILDFNYGLFKRAHTMSSDFNLLIKI